MFKNKISNPINIYESPFSAIIRSPDYDFISVSQISRVVFLNLAREFFKTKSYSRVGIYGAGIEGFLANNNSIGFRICAKKRK